MIPMGLVMLVVWFALMAAPPVRAFLGRHRVLVAVLVLPLQPFLLLLLIALGWTTFVDGPPDEEVGWRPILMGGIAYLYGLLAFAVVTAVQDRRGRRR